jgi:hypothetical protein
MNGFTRRQWLGGAALASAVGMMNMARFAAGARTDAVVYDGGHAASAAFADGMVAAHRIDLREQAAVHWRGLRNLTRGTSVAGLTSWSLYVAARGCLEGQGLRLLHEAIQPSSGLIAWRMG